MSTPRPARNLETIRRALAEVWDTQGRRFVTFEPVSGSGTDADSWVQYLDGEINVRWASADDPREALVRRGVRLPPGAFVSWHVAGSNAVIGVGDVQLDDVAVLVVSLLARVVASPDSIVAARIDDHR